MRERSQSRCSVVDITSPVKDCNWELDVAVDEDEAFAKEMEAMYLDDLSCCGEECVC